MASQIQSIIEVKINQHINVKYFKGKRKNHAKCGKFGKS
jgi:hypothetical protein